MIVKWHGWLCACFFLSLWAGLSISAHFQAMPNPKIQLLSHISGSTCILFNPYVTEDVPPSLCSFAIQKISVGHSGDVSFILVGPNLTMTMMWFDFYSWRRTATVFQMSMTENTEQASNLLCVSWCEYSSLWTSSIWVSCVGLVSLVIVLFLMSVATVRQIQPWQKRHYT